MRSEGVEESMDTTQRQRQFDRVIRGDRSSRMLGSDRKVPGGVTGTCGLCGIESVLRLSHIVPSWAYQWMKREGAVVGSLPSRGVVTQRQDGTKHYLLCEVCEQHLGQAEAYVAAFSRGTRADLDRLGVMVGDGPTVYGLNLAMVYRCLLGILIKAHYSDVPPFAASMCIDISFTDFAGGYSTTTTPPPPSAWSPHDG
jgi:hypothetical protein